MGRMGQDLGVKSNLKTGMKLKARKMQNLTGIQGLESTLPRNKLNDKRMATF